MSSLSKPWNDRSASQMCKLNDSFLDSANSFCTGLLLLRIGASASGVGW